MDRPHLVGWGSLHRIRRRSLTSLCHRPGTATPVPGPEGSWLDPHLAACVLRSPVRPRPPPCRTLRNDMSSNRDAFRRVLTDRVAPAVASVDAFWFECARGFAHRSHLGAAASCVSTWVRSAPWPASHGRFALRLLVPHDARCVRPTSAFSRSSYQYPRLVGSRCVMRLRACAIEDIACFTSVRFASVGRTFVVVSPRWALFSRRDACDPYLWHPCRFSHVSHVARATCAPMKAAETTHSPIA